jgi:uncharacterized protein (DUF885 family)
MESAATNSFETHPNEIDQEEEMRKLNEFVSLALVILTLLAAGCNPQPSPTPTVRPLSELAAGLEGLDIDTFFEESFKRLLLRDPEAVTELGLAETYGVGNDQLTDISDAYVRETQTLEEDTLYLLKQYDRASLTPEQRLTADIYAWYLEDRVQGHAFMYDDYPINQTTFGSVHTDLLHFFTDVHPVTSLQDAQDYVTRLSQVDTKFEQLIDGLRRRAEANVILPKFLIQWVVSDLQSIAQSDARDTPYYTAFVAKVNALADVSDADKQAVLKAAEREIDDTVIPAYQALVDYLTRLEAVATDDAGVSRFPNGQAYYAYLLRHYTTTDLTADEIHELGKQELTRIHAEMHAVFDELGYPPGAGLPTLYTRVLQDSGTVFGGRIVTTYEALIEEAEQSLGAAFDLRPQAGVIVVGVPAGDYYVPPALDGSRPGVFYASDMGYEALFSMPTVVYHEAVPGHHFQMALAQELNLPLLRRSMDFPAYVEGWALYAEQLAWELGAYEDDPYGNLGRLQHEALHAARLVVDTGIHAEGWTYDQAVEFMVENTGRPRRFVEYEVSRCIAAPGQATSYYVGFLKILELRQRAQEALGNRFDLKEFHNVLLGNGAMPLGILEQVVGDYIAEKRE